MSSSVILFPTKLKDSQTFNSSGTFTVPEGINTLYILGAGGGGGGAGGNGGGTEAGGGGAGAVPQWHVMQVSAGQSWTVTIGGGGSGGGVNNDGNPGGNSSFIRSGIGPTFHGGKGGRIVGATGIFGGGDGLNYDVLTPSSVSQGISSDVFPDWTNSNHFTYGGDGNSVNGGTGQSGQSSPYANGGNGGSGSDHGGGGGAGFGTGGNGSSTSSGTATDGGRSAGGGGGGGAKSGGDGGAGRIIVFW